MTNQNYVYGVHAVKNYIKMHLNSVELIYLQKNKVICDDIKRVVDSIKSVGGYVKLVDKVQLDKMTNSAVHQGVVVSGVDGRHEYGDNDLSGLLSNLSQNPLILILDCVQDPHNFGACLRTADAVGVDFVIFPKDKSASITGVVRKVSTGASESLKLVCVTNLVRAMKKLKDLGVWIVGLAGEIDETTIYDVDLADPVALVLGSEGSGLRRNTKNNCDYLVQLPMKGSVSSLNVSVAAGVSLYEALRQRRR